MLKNPICYDNGGETIDRLTIITGKKFYPGFGLVFEYISSTYIGLGVWEHRETKVKPGSHLGKRVPFKKLHPEVQVKYADEYRRTHRPANVLGAWETSGGYAIAYNPVKTGPLVRYSVMWMPSGVSCDAPMVDTFIGKHASIKGQRVAWWSLPPYVHSTFFQHS